MGKKEFRQTPKILRRNKIAISRVITAAATINYAGNKFCKACYVLEGDSNLIFRVDSILCNLERFTGLEEEHFVLPNNNEELNEEFDASIVMAIDLIQPFVKKTDEAREALATTSLVMLEASDALDDSMKKLEELQESPEST